ncbi:MAG: hypothetical protein ACUVTU_05585 [Desulfurispora sp.]|uniref:hypothetical protein n=1 Tax=Desulfurispora sp. TaxID=3014275 RepID=UPI004049A3AB
MTRKSRPKAPARQPGVWLLGLAGLLLAGLLASQLYGFLLRQLVRIEILSEGSMLVTLPLEGYLIKQEYPGPPLPEGARFQPLAPRGQRVRRGQVVGKISRGPGQVEEMVSAPASGIFWPEADGLERVLAPDKLDLLTPNWLAALDEQAENAAERGGQPAVAGKIIDNLAPLYLLAGLPAQATALPDGDWSTILWQGRSLAARKERQAGTRVFFRLENCPQDLVVQRRITCRLVLENRRGLVVKEGSVRQVDGRDCLLVVAGRRARAVPVEVKARDGKYLLVEGASLAAGQRYITGPGWVKPGQRVE